MFCDQSFILKKKNPINYVKLERFIEHKATLKIIFHDASLKFQLKIYQIIFWAYGQPIYWENPSPRPMAKVVILDLAEMVVGSVMAKVIQNLGTQSSAEEPV